MGAVKQLFATLLLLKLLYVSVDIVEATQKPQQCRFIYDSSFERCSMQRSDSWNFTNRIHATDVLQERRPSSCPDRGVCGKVFNVSQVQGQTLNEETLAMVSDMLRQCCGECGQFQLNELTEEISHMDMTDLEKSDIIFPFLGRESLRELYDYHYIPIFQLPGAYYFTLEMTEKELAVIIISGCLNMWPLLFICVLWAIIAGFFIWLCETWRNADQFPRSFVSGILDIFFIDDDIFSIYTRKFKLLKEIEFLFTF